MTTVSAARLPRLVDLPSADDDLAHFSARAAHAALAAASPRHVEYVKPRASTSPLADRVRQGAAQGR